MATEKVKSFPFNLEDIDALAEAVRYTLATQIKTGNHKRRVRLYRLQRRLTRARLELEK